MSVALATVVELHPSVSYETERPSEAQYRAYQQMFADFNEHLFDGTLPQPILTFSRRAKAAGFFAPDRWSARGDERTVSEIAVNPDKLKSEPPIEIASTLVHEMCHLWQHVHGQKKSRAGYHNAEWGQKMESIGLMPSSTGKPGGKRVGQGMSDYVIEGGRFEVVFKKMPDDWFLPFLADGPRPKKSSGSASSKVRFACQACGDNAWGKPTLQIGCRKCGVPMVADVPVPAPTSEPAESSDAG